MRRPLGALVNSISNTIDDRIREFDPSLNIVSVEQPRPIVTAPRDDCTWFYRVHPPMIFGRLMRLLTLVGLYHLLTFRRSIRLLTLPLATRFGLSTQLWWMEVFGTSRLLLTQEHLSRMLLVKTLLFGRDWIWKIR